MALWRRLFAELLGSAFLAAVVIGSGIAAQQLSPATSGWSSWKRSRHRGRAVRHHLDARPGLGGHFNPVVSLVDATFGGCPGGTPPPTWPPRSRVRRRGRRGQPDVLRPRSHLGQAPGHGRTSCPRSWPRWACCWSFSLWPALAAAAPPRRRSAPHRRRVLLHLLDQLRQPGHHHRAHVLEHLRRDRTRPGPGFIAAQIVGGALAVALVRLLYPRLSPAEAKTAVGVPRPLPSERPVP